MIDAQTKRELRAVFDYNLGHSFSRNITTVGNDQKQLLFYAAFAHGHTCAWEYAVEYTDIIQSPIEARLFAHLLFIEAYTPVEFAYSDEEPDGWSLHLRTQHEIGPYKADFHFTISRDNKRFELVVECDGHDFHEKTKEQAAHDKRRDRFFTGKDIRILRFTGSEIWRDACACAQEVAAFISGQSVDRESPRTLARTVKKGG